MEEEVASPSRLLGGVCGRRLTAGKKEECALWTVAWI